MSERIRPGQLRVWKLQPEKLLIVLKKTVSPPVGFPMWDYFCFDGGGFRHHYEDALEEGTDLVAEGDDKSGGNK